MILTASHCRRAVTACAAALLLHALSACAPAAVRTVDARALAVYRRDVAALTSPAMEGRGLGTAGHDRARDWVAQRFEQAGLQPGVVDAAGRPTFLQAFEVRYDDRDLPVHNVVGLLPGRGALARQVIVIGAHYDHLGYGELYSHDPDGKGVLHPGANDNASGVAALLRAARILEHQSQSDTQPRRTVVFAAFSAEEFGGHGSYNFLLYERRLAVDGAEVVAMVNLDMVGSLRDGPVAVWGVGSADGWRALLRDAAEQWGLRLVLHAERGPLSDHRSFLNARTPAVLLLTRIEGVYHTPADTADRIDAAGGVRVARFAAAVVDRLLHEPQPLRFTPPPTGADD